MNKSGSVVLFTMSLGIVIIILALALAPAVVEFTGTAMNETAGDIQGLDCNNESINNFNRAACLATDLTPFYFLGALIFIGGIIITAKVKFG